MKKLSRAQCLGVPWRAGEFTQSERPRRIVTGDCLRHPTGEKMVSAADVGLVGVSRIVPCQKLVPGRARVVSTSPLADEFDAACNFVVCQCPFSTAKLLKNGQGYEGDGQEGPSNIPCRGGAVGDWLIHPHGLFLVCFVLQAMAMKMKKVRAEVCVSVRL